jgi:hypothetical protein
MIEPCFALRLLEAFFAMPAAPGNPGQVGGAGAAGPVAGVIGDLIRIRKGPAGQQPAPAAAPPPGPDRDPGPVKFPRPVRPGPRGQPLPGPGGNGRDQRVGPALTLSRARSLPLQPGGPITVQRRVSSRGGLMVARQKIHAGMIHAGKTATVICENTCFRVVIDGETAAVAPRTTTSEVHRYKANATDKRSQPRPTPEGQ